jgi:hypothetical protein
MLGEVFGCVCSVPDGPESDLTIRPVKLWSKDGVSRPLLSAVSGRTNLSGKEETPILSPQEILQNRMGPNLTAQVFMELPKVEWPWHHGSVWL